MAGIFPLLLAPADDFFRIDDYPDYPMTFVSREKFRGRVDREAFDKALEIALERHPLFTALIGPAKRGKLCWVDSGAVRPRVDWADEDTPMECTDGGRIVLTQEVGLRIWVRQGSDTTQMVFLFHHGVTDGNGAHRFLGDLFAAYAYVMNGSPGEIPFDPIDVRELRARSARMGHVAIHGTPWQLIRLGLRQGYDLYCKRICPLAEPQRDPQGAPLMFPWQQTHFFEAGDYKKFRAAAGRLRVNPNELFILETFQTVIDWNREQGGSDKGLIRIVIPADLRGEDDFLMPASNMASFAHISRKASQCRDETALLRFIQEEMMAIKRENRAKHFIDAVMLLEHIPWTMHALSKLRKCMSTAVLTNVGDPSRRFRARFERERGKLVCGNLVLETMEGASPLRPKTRAAITVNMYGRALAVTANCDRYCFGQRETELLLRKYVARLQEHMQ